MFLSARHRIVNLVGSALAFLLIVLSVLTQAGSVETHARAVGEYTGMISAGENRRFFARMADAGAISRLVIRSPGGDVAAGIELGRWVSRNGIDVEVRDFCLSSCANYVFPAARRKILPPGAIVAWHGNYHHLEATGLWHNDVVRRVQRDGEDPEQARRAVMAQVEHLVGLERAFFQEIDVDERLCWIGKLPPHEVPDYFLLSPFDMARFGVADVQAPVDYLETEVSGFRIDIRPIRLGAFENDREAN